MHDEPLNFGNQKYNKIEPKTNTQGKVQHINV